MNQLASGLCKCRNNYLSKSWQRDWRKYWRVEQDVLIEMFIPYYSHLERGKEKVRITSHCLICTLSSGTQSLCTRKKELATFILIEWKRALPFTVHPASIVHEGKDRSINFVQIAMKRHCSALKSPICEGSARAGMLFMVHFEDCHRRDLPCRRLGFCSIFFCVFLNQT